MQRCQIHPLLWHDFRTPAAKPNYCVLYRVYSQISIAWNKHNGAAFSNSEHSDLIFLTKKITKKLNCQFPQTLLAEICSKPVSTCP